MSKTETIKWKVELEIQKFFNNESYKKGIPDEVLTVQGNQLTYDGTQHIWNRLIGSASTLPFNHESSAVGIGNSDMAIDFTDTLQSKLQGVNQQFVKMDDDFPRIIRPEIGNIEGVSLLFRSTFTEDQGNFDWREWGIANYFDPVTLLPNPAYIMLNRKVEPMGTKAIGSTWIVLTRIRLVS
jgi:hypothetical protein